MHSWQDVLGTAAVLSTAVALAATGCEKTADDQPVALPESGSVAQASTDVVVNDALDPVGAVAFLASLCEHASSGDHAWVRARVTLPLRGIYSINDVDEDPLVHPHESASVEDFRYMSYCEMLPPSGAALREYDRTDTIVSGIVNFGKVPHRIEVDLRSDPPRLTTLDARVPARPIPPRSGGKARAYELGALPFGFNKRAGSAELRQKVIAALRADPRCIEDYVERDTSAARFEVVVERGSDGKASTRVEPFQLVRASLLSCLRTQLPALRALSDLPPASAIVELAIPVSDDEIPPDAPVLQWGIKRSK